MEVEMGYANICDHCGEHGRDHDRLCADGFDRHSAPPVPSGLRPPLDYWSALEVAANKDGLTTEGIQDMLLERIRAKPPAPTLDVRTQLAGQVYGVFLQQAEEQEKTVESAARKTVAAVDALLRTLSETGGVK